MATVVRAATAGDSEEEEGCERERERESQGALMFVEQAGDLNTVTTLKLGCCNVAEC